MDDVRKMAEELYLEQKRLEEEAAKEITAGTFLAALGGALFPIIGIGAGVYHLTKGRTSKGFLFIGLAVAGWVFFCAIAGASSGTMYY